MWARGIETGTGAVSRGGRGRGCYLSAGRYFDELGIAVPFSPAGVSAPAVLATAAVLPL